jgi:hypothetical protein
MDTTINKWILLQYFVERNYARYHILESDSNMNSSDTIMTMPYSLIPENIPGNITINSVCI